MTGTIRFEYDEPNNILIAYPNWTINTQEDCDIWLKQWTDHLATFNRKMDCIMVLDDFNISPTISKVWGKYRADLVKTYMRFSYRVNSNPLTEIIVNTSGVKFQASSQDAKTLEAAKAAILEDRKNLI